MKPPNDALLDPVRFAKEMLGHSTWDTQDAILRSVAENRRTAVRACHGSSKTFTAAEAALWWAARYRDGKVIITASTFSQVRNVIWSEIHRAIRTSKFPFPVEANQTELRLSDSNFILGLSTDRGVQFQGFHGGHVLVIIDEAPGVDAAIWEAIEGIASAGQVHILALGNPTIPSGPFYEAFARDRGSWSAFVIDAFDTPNLRGLDLQELLALPEAELDVNERPYLITRRWVKEKYYSWFNGSPESSPLWQSRVRGEFPSQSENSLFSLAWLERAQERHQKDDGKEQVFAGIDVAGPGADLTVCTIVTRSGAILEQRAWASPDARGEVVAMLNFWRSRLATVRVDSAGIGYGFALHLRDQGFPTEMINVGESSTEPERFANLKAELFWRLRESFKDDRISNLNAETAAQLSAIQYSISPTGKIVIESKESLRKRGIRSPDHAESLLLSICPPDSGFTDMLQRFQQYRASGRMAAGAVIFRQQQLDMEDDAREAASRFRSRALNKKYLPRDKWGFAIW